MTAALRRAWRRLRAALHGDLLDREFDAEAAAHLDLAVDDLEQQGVPRAEAHRRARLAFGPMTTARDAHRDAGGLAWVDAGLHDLRLAVRGLRRDWRYALASVAMLTLALALNTTVYAVMDAMLLRGAPQVPRGHEIVYLQEHDALGRCCLSYADVGEWQARARSFQGIAAIGGGPVAVRDDHGRALDLGAAAVGTNLFGLLGVPPAHGRDFTAADAVPGARPVLLLSDRIWRTRFGARDDVVGAAVLVNGQPGQIVGVMPPGFEFPIAASGGVWMPLVPTADTARRGLTPGAFTAVGRLRKGVSLAQARAELEAINLALAAAYPDTNRGLVPSAVDHAQFSSGADARVIWGSTWIAGCLVLLVACANVANLTLVRTVGRWREFATCLALGAGRARMVRGLLVESTILVAAAAMPAGVLMQWGVTRWAAMAASQYQAVDYTLTAGTWLYLAAASVAAGALISLAPVVRILQLGATGTLRDEGRGVTQTRQTRRVVTALVAGQMTLAVVLLAGAGVLARSLANILNAETGVRHPEAVLVGMLRLPSERYPSPEARLLGFDRIADRLRSLGGVERVALSNTVPVKFGSGTRRVEVEGQPLAADDRRSATSVATASPGYFDVIGARILDGRDFTQQDVGASAPVAVVNERFAALWWPGEPAVGKRLRALGRDGPGPWVQVVGLVTNVMHSDALRQQFKPHVYVPLAQDPPTRRAFFLLRTAGPADRLAAAVRAEIQAVDGDVELDYVDTLQGTFRYDRDYMDAEHSELGKYATLAPVFAGLALLLAGTGLVAVIAHAVAQRTREIGVRMAVGAGARDIRRLVLAEGLRPVAVGLAAGMLGALAVNRLLRSQLVGVSPFDPLVLVATSVVLVAVAIGACRLPVRRALAVDPAVVLRHD